MIRSTEPRRRAWWRVCREPESEVREVCDSGREVGGARSGVRRACRVGVGGVIPGGGGAGADVGCRVRVGSVGGVIPGGGTGAVLVTTPSVRPLRSRSPRPSSPRPSSLRPCATILSIAESLAGSTKDVRRSSGVPAVGANAGDWTCGGGGGGGGSGAPSGIGSVFGVRPRASGAGRVGGAGLPVELGRGGERDLDVRSDRGEDLGAGGGGNGRAPPGALEPSELSEPSGAGADADAGAGAASGLCRGWLRELEAAMADWEWSPFLRPHVHVPKAALRSSLNAAHRWTPPGGGGVLERGRGAAARALTLGVPVARKCRVEWAFFDAPHTQSPHCAAAVSMR